MTKRIKKQSPGIKIVHGEYKTPQSLIDIKNFLDKFKK
jgi:hypothetical protein